MDLFCAGNGFAGVIILVFGTVEDDMCSFAAETGLEASSASLAVSFSVSLGVILSGCCGRELFLGCGFLYTALSSMDLNEANPCGVLCKSANIVLKKDYTAQLIDCGLAKFVKDDDNDEALASSAGVKGTPGYICNEHADGLPFEAACDLFSFGDVINPHSSFKYIF